MKLKIKNVGKIDNVVIDIDTITVVAGKNDTGKSTIAKAFYTTFNSFSHYKDQIRRERINNVLSNLSYRLTEVINKRYGEFVLEIFNSFNKKWDYEEFKRFLVSLVEKYKDFNKNLVLSDNDIKPIYTSISTNDDDILKKIISRRIESEFDHQVSNFYNKSESEILLNIKNDEYKLLFKNNSFFDYKYVEELYKKAIYIDDPFILDETNNRLFSPFDNIQVNNYYHRNDAVESLRNNDKRNVIDEIKIDEHFKRIESLLNEIEVGSLVYDRNITYNKNSIEKNIELSNVSAGLKTFIIIKTLIYNKSIDMNGTLILDEPEIHLHPEWQILLARLIVLLQKEFGLHILITTHSPYFLEALEVYSKKYKIGTKFYLLEKDDNNKSNLRNVTNNVDEIYKQMANPFIELEEISNEIRNK